jgi:hypothetical protein
MKHSPARENIYSLIEQNGPFFTGDRPPSANAFSRKAKEFANSINAHGMVTKYRMIRNQVFEFLDVKNFSEIQLLLNNEKRISEVRKRGYMLLGNMFGIEGNEREIVSRVKSYSSAADDVIRYLQGKVLANYASYIEMTNEIDATSSPVDLLLIVFNDRYHKKARFEAKRKLILMKLAGSIDQRERETDVEKKFYQFLEFLNAQVWSKKSKIGELELSYLLSSHDEESFSCKDVKVLAPDTAYNLARKKGQKLTLIKRRRFQANGREIPIYVTIRKKAPAAKVLKLLRKNEENPAIAVDDELGLMGVLDSVMDVKTFQKHLTKSAIKANSFMTLEDVSDSLAGGRHGSGNVGSSSKTSMLKFFARMGGMRVEFIVHTNKSYLNYIYQRDVSHDEYEVKRIFDSGVAELLFPRDIYHLDMGNIKNELIRWFRKRIESF